MGAANLNGRLRAFRWRRQGLEGSLAKASAAKVLEETGWMRSIGGASPYLGLFARAGVSREQADQDAAALRIHELPAARGCTYVDPLNKFVTKQQVLGMVSSGFLAMTSLKREFPRPRAS